MHSFFPLHEMAIRFGLIDMHPRKKVGRKSYFSPKGEVPLMFLKSYTGLSAPKLMEQLKCKHPLPDILMSCEQWVVSDE